MQRIKSAVVAALFLTIPVPAAAQHWSFDARRIALGGVGSANLASELVADRRAYKATSCCRSVCSSRWATSTCTGASMTLLTRI